MASEDTFTIHPSTSQEALDVLVNAGVDPIVAEQMLSRVDLQEPEHSQSEQSSAVGEDERGRASFERRMLDLMEGFSQRLTSLEATVETTRRPTMDATPTGVAPSPLPSTSSVPLSRGYDTPLPPV